MVLSMLRESIFVSFTTDLKGSLTNIDLAVSDFELAMEDGTLKLSVALGITVNGKIEVTWGDIVTDINGAEVLPPEDMKDAAQRFISDKSTTPLRGLIYCFGLLVFYAAVMFLMPTLLTWIGKLI